MSLWNGSIHGLREYQVYVPIIDFTVLQAFIPFIYVVPTVVVMITILVKYQMLIKKSNSAAMDHNIFAFIMFYFLFNMLFFIGDYFRLNLPTSGLKTSWCSNTEPNRFFTAILIFAYASNYGDMICPFLVCLMRLTIMLSPRQNERYCKLITYRFAIPFLFLAPIALTLFNITELAFCKQLDDPFEFGSIMISEGEYYAKINVFIHLTFSSLIFVINFGMTTFMFFKLRSSKLSTTSSRTKELTKKAEFSLFLAVASSVVPFVTNGICSMTFLLNRPYWNHVMFIRPIGNDYETVMMPWMLFLTHPMFARKKTILPGSKTTSNIVITSSAIQALRT